MFNLGGMEILVILVVALLVLGPDKLPSVMRTIGKAVGELRRASTEFQRTMNTEIRPDELLSSEKKPDDDAPKEPPWEAASVSEPGLSVPEATTPVPEAAPAAAPPSPKRTLPRASRARRMRSRNGGGPENP